MRCCGRSLHRLQPYQWLTPTQHQHCITGTLHGAHLVPTLLFGEIQGPCSLTVQLCSSVHMCMYVYLHHWSTVQCLTEESIKRFGSACAITYEKESCMQKSTCKKMRVHVHVCMYKCTHACTYALYKYLYPYLRIH